MQPHPLELMGMGARPWLLSVASKCVETIMQLRVDVKKEQTDRFRDVLGAARRSAKFKEQSAVGFLAELIPKDLYNALNRLQRHPSGLNFPLTIELSLVNKKTQERETVECWHLSFELDGECQPQSAYPAGSSDLRRLQEFFDDLVEMLAHLPFWERYWKDNNRRRASKLTHFLDFKLSFGQKRLPEDFEYEEKHQRKWVLTGLAVKLSAYVRQNIESLRSSEKSEKSEATRTSRKPLLQKVSTSSSASTKRHSFYSYEDEELDVTILSSDSDFSPKSIGIEPVPFTVEDCSDEEFVLVLDNEEDTRRSYFQQRLEELKVRAELLETEYSN